MGGSSPLILRGELLEARLHRDALRDLGHAASSMVTYLRSVFCSGLSRLCSCPARRHDGAAHVLGMLRTGSPELRGWGTPLEMPRPSSSSTTMARQSPFLRSFEYLVGNDEAVCAYFGVRLQVPRTATSSRVRRPAPPGWGAFSASALPSYPVALTAVSAIDDGGACASGPNLRLHRHRR